MGGSMGKILFFVGSNWNFVPGYKKRWHTSWKFQLEITSNKKVITKKPLPNLLEMFVFNYTGFALRVAYF